MKYEVYFKRGEIWHFLGEARSPAACVERAVDAALDEQAEAYAIMEWMFNYKDGGLMLPFRVKDTSRLLNDTLISYHTLTPTPALMNARLRYEE